ncbi:WXG100 family type VII secretion target [Lentzea sp. BCCO 10_0798]|uniref:ESAT-6-like protein n=1 Tax=Lentzea kristufekii TaxID=3095430 RepID=A0ABU4TV45_9PSEU|nr:WXG100 family type VII secretion target [Lentzea sp. BCCO 10_0798]MDX8052136.1 WXG100 family type VII secretion target [Lentzea sp. BCCO 10_0798]
MALEVTAAELDALAKRIIDVDQSTQGTLRQVQNAVDQVSSSWKGDANTAFMTLMTRFQEDAKKVSEALNTIAESIASSATVYATQEEDNSSSISALQSRLNG